MKTNLVSTSAVYNNSWVSSLAVGKKQPLYPGLKSSALRESNCPSNHNWCINRFDLQSLRGELFRVKDGVLLVRIIYLAEGSWDPSLVVLAKEVLACCHQIQAEFTCVTQRWVTGTIRSVNIEHKTLSLSAWRCACPAPAETRISNWTCKYNNLEKDLYYMCGILPSTRCSLP